MSAERLPDELWLRIVETGVKSFTLTHRDLCSLSISCRRFLRFTSDDSLWAPLLLFHFCNSCDSHVKSAFRSKYEMLIEGRGKLRMRELRRMEGRIWNLEAELRGFQQRLKKENQKLKLAMKGLENLDSSGNVSPDYTISIIGLYLSITRIGWVYSKSVSEAMNVWQPEVVSDRQHQIVDQHDVPMEIRAQSYQMEIKACNAWITGLVNTIKSHKKILELERENLALFRSQPLEPQQSQSGTPVPYWKM